MDPYENLRPKKDIEYIQLTEGDPSTV